MQRGGSGEPSSNQSGWKHVQTHGSVDGRHAPGDVSHFRADDVEEVSEDEVDLEYRESMAKFEKILKEGAKLVVAMEGSLVEN